MWNEEWRMNSLFEKNPWAMYMQAIKKTIANNERMVVVYVVIYIIIVHPRARYENCRPFIVPNIY